MLYSRKQLAELLNTSVDSIKKMNQRNTLDDNLKKQGYKLIGKTKQGRNILYELEKVSVDNQVLYNIGTYVFNVNDPIKFNKYFIERTSNIDIPITQEEIGGKVNVSAMTIHNWDNKLKEKEIICNDGFFYMKKNQKTNETFQISKEEFNMYWKNRSDTKKLRNVLSKVREGTITIDEGVAISQQVTSIETLIEGFTYFKIRKFRLYEDNQLYVDIRDMILGDCDFSYD
jgi:hypothetical protein